MYDVYSKLLPLVRLSPVIGKVIACLVLLSIRSSPLSLSTSCGSTYDLTARLKELKSFLHEGPAIRSKLTVLILSEGIETTAQGAFIGKCTRYLTLQLCLCLANNTCVVDEPVFGSILLGFKSAEQSFLGAKNLNCRCWLLGQIHQTTRV